MLAYGGATCESSPSDAQSRKVVRLQEMKIAQSRKVVLLEEMKIVFIDLKWIKRKAKVCSWFSILPVSSCQLRDRIIG